MKSPVFRDIKLCTSLKNVFARSNTEIVGSTPTEGMDACLRLFCLCVGLAAG
jgi:hypothetical protein